MASFSEHIQQAKRNLVFLESINSIPVAHWDWQVTVCYYAGVHIVNAHLATTINQHYRSHEHVKNALNPFNNPQLAGCIPAHVYTEYTALENLSRKSRYLISDNLGNLTTNAQFTAARHFAKAVRHLDMVIDYFGATYNLAITPIRLQCPNLSSADNLKSFTF